MNDSSFQTPLFAIGIALVLAVLFLLGSLVLAVIVLSLVFPTTPAA
jgi:phage shock protein PspC (stress-responsive transcriptional regulator)